MADGEKSKTGKVGYGQPPKETQYKKGQSGNSRGRPPKSRGLRAIAQLVFSEKQRLANQPKGARVKYSILEVVVMSLKHLATGGHAPAATYLEKFSDRHGPQKTPLRGGLLVVPERLTEEEWEAKYSPKDPPPGEAEAIE